MDDPFQPCFQCENTAQERNFYKQGGHQYFYARNRYHYLERQSGERFEATSQSRRIICPRGTTRGSRCRIRVSRAIQFRRRSYPRTQRFVHAEEYISGDDLEIIRFFQTLFQ